MTQAKSEEIKCPPENLAEKPLFNVVRDQQKCKQDEIREKEKILAESKNLLDDETAENDGSPATKIQTAKVSKEAREVDKLKAELTAIEKEETQYKNELLAVRKQMSDRYSSRLVWVFFTAIYMLLCVGCLIVGFGVAFRAFEGNWLKTGRFLGITSLVAVLFVIFVFSNKDHYMFILEEMFNQSLNPRNEMPSNLIIFFNVLGLGASAFLIAASCAVLRSVNLIEESTETTDQKLDEYVHRLQYLKNILYIGTAMLVVGIFRLKSLLEWHKAFITTESASVFVELYDNFAKTLLSVEGAFYSLMLASIYLPAAYIVRLKAYDLPLKDENGKILSHSLKEELLKQQHLVFSLGDFAPRLLVILSPFLTGQISDLFSYFKDS